MQIIFKNCCILFAIFGANHFQELGLPRTFFPIWRFFTSPFGEISLPRLAKDMSLLI